MAFAVSVLKQQIEQAKQSLKNVDDNIKKVTGRDPNDARFETAGRGGRGREVARLGRRVSSGQVDGDEPPAKRSGGIYRRIGSTSSGGRLLAARRRSHQQQSDDDDDDTSAKPVVQSSVVSTAKKVTKTQIISAQNVDEKGKARNRRMFGMLMGTLARFQNEESRADMALKQEMRRSEIERRLEEAQATDRRRIAAERRELFSERRSKQHKIALLEEKVELSGEFEEWEKEWMKKSSFLVTKAAPCVFFLPKEMTARTTRALKNTEKFIKDKITEGRASLKQTLDEIDRDIAALEPEEKKEGEKKGDGEKKGEEVDDLTEEPAVDINVEMEDGDKNDVGGARVVSVRPKDGGGTEEVAACEERDSRANGDVLDDVKSDQNEVPDDVVRDVADDVRSDQSDVSDERGDVENDVKDNDVKDNDVKGDVIDEAAHGGDVAEADGKLPHDDLEEAARDEEPVESTQQSVLEAAEEEKTLMRAEPEAVANDDAKPEEGPVDGGGKEAAVNEEDGDDEGQHDRQREGTAKPTKVTKLSEEDNDDEVMIVSQKDEVIVVSSRSPTPKKPRRKRSPSPKRRRRRSPVKPRPSSRRSRRDSSPRRRVQKRSVRSSSSSSSSSVTSSDSEPQRRRRRRDSSSDSSSSSSSTSSSSPSPPPRQRRRSRERRRSSSRSRRRAPRRRR